MTKQIEKQKAQAFEIDLSRNSVWRLIGKVSYYLLWPAIWLMISMSPKRTRVLVVVDGQLLLAHDWLSPGKWSIPGGGLHKGEDPSLGAVRELEEETGVCLNVKQLVHLGEIKVVNNFISTKLVVYMVNLPRKPRLRIAGLEILEHRWVDASALKQIKIDNSTSQILNSFADRINLLQ